MQSWPCLLLPGLASGVLRRLSGRSLAILGADHGRPLRRLIRSSEIGGCLRGGGDTPGAGIFQGLLRPGTPLRTIAMNGHENAAVSDSARVAPGDVFDLAQARQPSRD